MADLIDSSKIRQIWMQLFDARKLLLSDVERLEERLSDDSHDIDARISLLGYYTTYEKNKWKHPKANLMLSEHVLWFIHNTPGIELIPIGDWISKTALGFTPRQFSTIRAAWLEQVAAHPTDGNVIGNAAAFIGWVDLETATELFERAYELQPYDGWLWRLVLHFNSELSRCPELYKDEVRKKIVDFGIKSLDTECGSPKMTCEFVSDAALSLGRYDVVECCANVLYADKHEQIARAYMGLVFIRKGNVALAKNLLPIVEKSYQPERIVFQLAHELFDLGEREAIVDFIYSFRTKIRKSVKDRWLKQVSMNLRPDFQDYCNCRSCRERLSEAKG